MALRKTWDLSDYGTKVPDCQIRFRLLRVSPGSTQGFPVFFLGLPHVFPGGSRVYPRFSQLFPGFTPGFSGLTLGSPRFFPGLPHVFPVFSRVPGLTVDGNQNQRQRANQGKTQNYHDRPSCKEPNEGQRKRPQQVQSQRSKRAKRDE